ncbi:Regulator of G-protein signaling 9-binding protein [Platysternon megacephalum]|uniref:Regulator of G-protein signaling 9-binding protein n=1 Tax=Platysternon megacephalum TaxID=55544 RepID=A0A4D9DW62_9SAUR|nr:Regulator of G-protein signaling 9-binding protein [Platysternon megacephalum]
MVTLNARLPAGLRNMLLAGLRQPLASPEERQELERLWVLSLSALELFHQDLHRAHHLCQLFPLQGRGVQLLSTGVAGKATDGGHKPWRRPSRKGARSTEQLGTAPDLEEQIEHMGTMLLEMETRVNVPVWTVEATEEARPESSLACEAEGSCSERQVAGGPGCCGQCQGWPAVCCTLS